MKVVLGILIAIGLALLIASIQGLLSWMAVKVIRRAARMLPAEYQARYEEEWLAELATMKDGAVSALLLALSLQRRAHIMRDVLEEMGRMTQASSQQRSPTVAAPPSEVMDYPDLSHAVWRQSSLSRRLDANVQIAFVNDRVAMRDGKNRTGPVISWSSRAWDEFLQGVQNGEFDLLK
jgi:hypothetical protein